MTSHGEAPNLEKEELVGPGVDLAGEVHQNPPGMTHAEHAAGTTMSTMEGSEIIVNHNKWKLCFIEHNMPSGDNLACGQIEATVPFVVGWVTDENTRSSACTELVD